MRPVTLRGITVILSRNLGTLKFKRDAKVLKALIDVLDDASTTIPDRVLAAVNDKLAKAL